MQKYSTPAIMSVAIIPTLTFVGFILSLVIAAVLKKQNMNPFDNAMKNVEN